MSFYILAGFIKPNQRSNEAAVKYFLLGAFSLGILLYGMSLMYGLSGTTNLRVMAAVFAGQERDPRLDPGGDPGRRRHGLQDRRGAVPHVGARRLRRARRRRSPRSCRSGRRRRRSRCCCGSSSKACRR